jgi:hypothetical protein
VRELPQKLKEPLIYGPNLQSTDNYLNLHLESEPSGQLLGAGWGTVGPLSVGRTNVIGKAQGAVRVERRLQPAESLITGSVYGSCLDEPSPFCSHIMQREAPE